MKMKIEATPSTKRDRDRLDRAIAETSARYVQGGCCIVRRDGIEIARIGGVTTQHCYAIARQMGGNGSWSAGSC